MSDARVIGAGITGLAAAWRLACAGLRVEIVDAASRPGGLLWSATTPHGLVEHAANAFVWNATVAAWFTDLDIEPIFARGESRRRFIFARGRPRRWPLRLVDSPVFAARMATAWITGGMKPRGDESVEAWGHRVMGHAATSQLLAPALQGIYAADPSDLAARAVFGHTSRIAGAKLAAPSGGMRVFVSRLHERLVDTGATFVFDTPVVALDPAVPTIVATDARAAAALMDSHTPSLAEALASISMTRMITATAFFEPRDRDLRGFGVLFPRDTGVGALGALFNTEIFARGERYRSETWIYGATRAGDALPAPDDLVATIVRDRGVLTGRDDTPVAVYPTTYESALPVYGTSILGVIDHMRDLPPWLALACNATGRIGVSKLLTVAEEAADRIIASRRR